MGFYQAQETSVLPRKYRCRSVYPGFSFSCTYLHNTAGCITSISYQALNIGLTWNSQYQLTAVSTNPAGGGTGGVECERNGYDALGRRVWTWNPSTGSGQAATNYFIYDGAHVLAEVDSTGGLRRAYTHGPGIDNWLAMTVYTGATVKTYFYITDHQGTVHSLADETGVIVESYRYDAWGRVLGVYDSNNQQLDNSQLGNRYLFQGREYSWQSGLYYFRARWYDPITGRWLSNDPIGISGGLNQYVFCGNNPVNCVDPFGLIPPVRQEDMPEGVDIHAIIKEAEGIESTYGFAWRVRPGGKWDIRHNYLGKGKHGLSRQKLTDLGNYIYGLTGAAVGFDHPTLNIMAGIVQYLSGKWFPIYGPFPSDNPVDAYWVKQGFNDYKNGFWEKVEPPANPATDAYSKGK